MGKALTVGGLTKLGYRGSFAEIIFSISSPRKITREKKNEY